MANIDFPKVILLRRADSTGYGFFFINQADYLYAAGSFTRPVLASFKGDPQPDQPRPEDHVKAAIQEFLGQAFNRSVPREVGAEGVSRAAAALARQTFPDDAPPVILIEKQAEQPATAKAALGYMRHPGFPRAIIIDADTHGGDACFFDSEEGYRSVGESVPDAACWLPQIIFRLYEKTPSIMVGRPMTDRASGRHSVECRAIDFGGDGALIERRTRL